MNDKEYVRILDKLAHAMKDRSCVLFLGPACSETVKLRSELGLSREMPTQKTVACALAEELDDEALLPGIERICGDCPVCEQCLLPEAAEQFEEARGRFKLVEFIRELLRDGRPRGFHRQIWNLRFWAIYTINYDELVERSQEGTDRIVPLASEQVFGTVSRPIQGKVPYYKLHGCISGDAVVITAEDQLGLKRSRDQSERWGDLSIDLRDKVFLFVGYGLADASVLQTIYSVHSSGHSPPRSYAVIEEPMPMNARRLQQRYNIQPVHQDTDQFFEDLVKRYRLLMHQESQRSFTTKLEQRYPTIWTSFGQVLSEQGFSGLCLYGQGKNQEENALVESELSTVPAEMREECIRRQTKNEKLLNVSHSIVQLGAEVYVDPQRFIRLLQEVAEQLDSQRARVELEPLGLAEELERQYRTFWKMEADARVRWHWQRVLRDCDPSDLEDALERPTQEQLTVTRERRERYLTAQASDWFFWELDSALDGHRLIVFLTGFELIEIDETWLRLVSDYFLKKLIDFDAGLVIARRKRRKMSVKQTFGTYNLDRFTQFDLAASFREGG